MKENSLRNINKDTNEKFIPTRDEWWVLYAKWVDKIASALWRYGTKEDCHEAARDAFLTVMGVHPKFRLQDPLEPKCEGQWYAFIRYRARCRLGNMKQHDSRAQGYSTTDEAEVGVFGFADYDIDSVCRKDFRAAIRRVVLKTCREQGFGEKAIAGFVATKLGGLSGREVVQTVKGISNENALYVCNKRVFDQLKAIAKDPASELYALWAA